MGDRSNIVIEQHDGSRVWLYGHWMGSDSIDIVRTVLARHDRWEDESYLARMIFNKMTEGDPKGSLGYGISTSMCDNEYPVIVLNPKAQTVTLENSPWGTPMVAITPAVSFETFIGCGGETNPSFADVSVDMGAKLTPA